MSQFQELICCLCDKLFWKWGCIVGGPMITSILDIPHCWTILWTQSSADQASHFARGNFSQPLFMLFVLSDKELCCTAPEAGIAWKTRPTCSFEWGSVHWHNRCAITGGRKNNMWSSGKKHNHIILLPLLPAQQRHTLHGNISHQWLELWKTHACRNLTVVAS